MEIKLFRPHSLEEALSQRAQYGKDALPLAGGQSLLVMLRNKLIDPQVLLDLEPLGELRGLQARANGVSIGGYFARSPPAARTTTPPRTSMTGMTCMSSSPLTARVSRTPAHAATIG